MPKIFDLIGYQIFFFSNEGNEPCHIHVGKSRSNSSKFWIVPEVKVAHNKSNIPPKDLRKILDWIDDNTDFILQKWHEFFS